MPLPLGDRAPDFALRDQHGAEFRLSSYAGEKAVLLVFFPYAFSGVCTGELTGFRDRLGADYDTLWARLNSVGKHDKAGAAAVIEEITAAFDKQRLTLAGQNMELGGMLEQLAALRGRLPETFDPADEFGPAPKTPVAIWGWGTIPDQYGRQSFDDEDD